MAGRAVETAGGFLILRRDPLRLALYEQLLVEAGAGRTMEEALSLAGELIEQARAGQSLGALAERTPATRRTLAGPIPQTGPQAEARLRMPEGEANPRYMLVYCAASCGCLQGSAPTASRDPT